MVIFIKYRNSFSQKVDAKQNKRPGGVGGLTKEAKLKT